MEKYRQSWLNTADICAERARLSVVSPREETTDAAAIGTAVHAGIEIFIQGQLDTYEDCLNHIYTELLALTKLPTFRWVKYTPANAYPLAETFFSHWWNEMADNIDRSPDFTEVHFDLPFHDTRISGTMDYANGTILRDWKTSGRGEYQKWQYERWAIQPTVYTWAWHQLTGDILPFEYVIMHAKGVQRFTVHRDETDFKWLHTKIANWEKLWNAELDGWPVNDNHALCSAKWCPWWDDCKGSNKI